MFTLRSGSVVTNEVLIEIATRRANKSISCDTGIVKSIGEVAYSCIGTSIWRTSHKFSTQVVLRRSRRDLVRHPDSTLS